MSIQSKADVNTEEFFDKKTEFWLIMEPLKFRNG